MAAECKYKELYRYLKEQFIYGLNVTGVMEIIYQLTSKMGTMSVMSKEIMA